MPLAKYKVHYAVTIKSRPTGSSALPHSFLSLPKGRLACLTGMIHVQWLSICEHTVHDSASFTRLLTNPVLTECSLLPTLLVTQTCVFPSPDQVLSPINRLTYLLKLNPIIYFPFHRGTCHTHLDVPCNTHSS
jgi:hypothetical protein